MAFGKESCSREIRYCIDNGLVQLNVPDVSMSGFRKHDTRCLLNDQSIWSVVESFEFTNEERSHG